MGGISQREEKKQLTTNQVIEGLQFYEDTYLEQFGPIKIFKQIEPPYKYMMLYSENGIDDRTTVQKMQQKLKWYQSFKRHPHIVDIQAVRLIQKSQMCIKKIALELYSRYYNCTLEMGILRKLQRNKRFKEADLFYILSSLLEIWKHINQFLYNKYVQLFNINNIFITPQGFVKMYPFPIDIDFVSSPLKPKQTHNYNKSLLLNEQVLMDMSVKRTSLHTTNAGTPKPMKQLTDKDNLKDIGMILLQLILLNKELDEISDFPLQKQIELLNQFENQQSISAYFKDIIITLLSRYKETSYQELKYKIEFYKVEMDRAISTNIKLEEGPEFSEIKDIEKTSNLRRLSQHKNLKTGIISIMSKKNSQKET